MKTGKHPHAVLAMHAFSLEECGEYGRAEQAARAALVLSPLDARAQYVGFVGDGGYDHPEFWEPAGGQWLQGEGRRGPRYVEQIGVASGAVVQTRFGNAMRMLGHQPAMHMSWWEADAWCRWAGRRLPAEVEWEVAAHTASRRGFRWGDVGEWMGTSFRPYPGFAPDPYADYSQPWFGTHQVLRGASFATRARLKHPKFRNFYLPEHLGVVIRTQFRAP